VKQKKTKKDKPLYDENGKWVDQDMRVLGGIRRAYRVSPQMQETKAAARVELPPKIKKNGEPGKRNQVRFRCAICDGLFSGNNIQIDHIEPATPLGKTIKDMSWDDVVDGIFCGIDNLQVVCSTPMKRNNGLPSCHAKKSAEENWIRRKLATEEYNDEMWLNRIEVLEEEYQQYLIEKVEKLKAKEERKIEREKRKIEKGKKK